MVVQIIDGVSELAPHHHPLPHTPRPAPPLHLAHTPSWSGAHMLRRFALHIQFDALGLTTKKRNKKKLVYNMPRPLNCSWYTESLGKRGGSLSQRHGHQMPLHLLHYSPPLNFSPSNNHAPSAFTNYLPLFAHCAGLAIAEIAKSGSAPPTTPREPFSTSTLVETKRKGGIMRHHSGAVCPRISALLINLAGVRTRGWGG